MHRWQVEALGHDADHGIRLVHQADGAPRNTAVPTEAIAPQLVAQNDELRPVRHVLRIGEGAPEHWAGAENAKEGSRHLQSVGLVWLAGAAETLRKPDHRGHRFEAARPFTPVDKVVGADRTAIRKRV